MQGKTLSLLASPQRGARINRMETNLTEVALRANLGNKGIGDTLTAEVTALVTTESWPFYET